MPPSPLVAAAMAEKRPEVAEVIKNAPMGICDSDCPAAALVRWLGQNGPLELCGHHNRDMGPGLTAQGFVVSATA